MNYFDRPIQSDRNSSSYGNTRLGNYGMSRTRHANRWVALWTAAGIALIVWALV